VANLGAASREGLMEMIAAQQAQIEALLARVAALEEEVRRLRQGGGAKGELSINPSRPPKGKKERKHRAQSFVVHQYHCRGRDERRAT